MPEHLDSKIPVAPSVPPAPSAPSAALRGESAPPDLHTQLTHTTQELANLKRDRHIARALYEHQVIDEDIATVLIEHELAAKPDADIAALVTNLKQRKPNLFRHAAPATPTASRASTKPTPPTPTLAPTPAPTEDPKRAALTHAATAGHRPSILAYMRLRRQPA